MHASNAQNRSGFENMLDKVTHLLLFPRSTPVVSVLYNSSCSICTSVKVKVKVKFTLEQSTKAQRGEQMHSPTLPSTSALDGGGWSTPIPGRFTPGKDPVPIV